MEISRTRTIIVIILAFLLTFGANVLMNYLANTLAGHTPIVVALIFGLIAMVFAYIFLRQQVIGFRLKTPLPIPPEEDPLRHAHRGLILPIGLYSPQKGNSMLGKSQDDWLVAAKQENYHALDFIHSNLSLAITAAQTHRCSLEHIWILTTTSSGGNSDGSLDYAGALAKYFQNEMKISADKIHLGPQYSIPTSSEVAITQKTANLVNQIYKQARKLKLKDEEIIADVTSGTRALQLGVILACLDIRRKIQFIGTKYVDGIPDGSKLPILYEFEPVASPDIPSF